MCKSVAVNKLILATLLAFYNAWILCLFLWSYPTTIVIFINMARWFIRKTLIAFLMFWEGGGVFWEKVASRGGSIFFNYHPRRASRLESSKKSQEIFTSTPFVSISLGRSTRWSVAINPTSVYLITLEVWCLMTKKRVAEQNWCLWRRNERPSSKPHL